MALTLCSVSLRAHGVQLWLAQLALFNFQYGVVRLVSHALS